MSSHHLMLQLPVLLCGGLHGCTRASEGIYFIRMVNRTHKSYSTCTSFNLVPNRSLWTRECKCVMKPSLGFPRERPSSVSCKRH